MYALVVTNVVNIHFTYRDTLATVYALVSFQLDAKERELVEEAVECAEGAEETAEDSVNEYRAYYNADCQRKFPCEQRTKHCKYVVIVGICK